MCYFAMLGEEVLIQIFACMNVRTVTQASACCRQVRSFIYLAISILIITKWRRISNDHFLWYLLYQYRWEDADETKILRERCRQHRVVPSLADLHRPEPFQVVPEEAAQITLGKEEHQVTKRKRKRRGGRKRAKKALRSNFTTR